jgi:phage baseplate assembly protein gpV
LQPTRFGPLMRASARLNGWYGQLSRRKPTVKKWVAPAIEEAVGAIALEPPAWGQRRAANELTQRGGSLVAAGVRWVWERHNLENLPKRLKA